MDQLACHQDLDVVSIYYENLQHTTHDCKQTAKMEYSWHPWYGIELEVISYFKREDIEFIRGYHPGTGSRPRFDLPAWMFDSKICSRIKLHDHPSVNVYALNSARQLLNEIFSEGISQCTISCDNLEQGDSHEKQHTATNHSQSSVVR